MASPASILPPTSHSGNSSGPCVEAGRETRDKQADSPQYHPMSHLGQDGPPAGQHQWSPGATASAGIWTHPREMRVTSSKLAPTYSSYLLSSCCFLALKIILPADRAPGDRWDAKHTSLSCNHQGQACCHEHQTFTNYLQRTGW